VPLWAGVRPDVPLDLLVLILLAVEVASRLLRACMGPMVSLDLFLFLRGVALVLHVTPPIGEV
jgi:hypothetical protein